MTVYLRDIPADAERDLAFLLAQAFAGDQPLRRVLGLDQRGMDVFWQITARLYCRMEDRVRLGAYEGENLVGAAVGWESAAPPDWSLHWLYAWRLLRRLGPRALWQFGRWIGATTQQCAPHRRCLRLISFGVLADYRRQKLGEKLLAGFCRIAEDSGLEAVQLECAESNPARQFYERFGFNTETTFAVGGVTWHVMSKLLSPP